ncbi:MAG: CPBP family glutamic-type intramembrane protease [Kiritimatiellaeota bacterium]|nr:CPBP family glutamic-type intramembrane protease [Kiritimatiellota bacterium]
MAVEFALFYIACPLVLWRLALSGARVWVIPFLWVAAILAAVWLARKRGWTREKFFGLRGVKRNDWLWLGLRALVGAAVLTVVLGLLAKPARLFVFPREHTRFWTAVMLAYPVASVFPQGIVYRALFFERYAPLFGRFAFVASVAAFSFCHIVFNNPHALVLTFFGGLLFSWQYRRTGSLMFAGMEHALMGDLAFTIGWGMYLHGGMLAARGGG